MIRPGCRQFCLFAQQHPRARGSQYSTIPWLKWKGYRAQHMRLFSSLPNLPLLHPLASHDQLSTSVVHSTSGRTFTYGNLLGDVISAQDKLKTIGGRHSRLLDLQGKPVAFLAENSYDYVVTLLSILAADGIALPLSPSFPAAELRYILDNSQAEVLLATERYREQAEQVLKGELTNPPALEFIPKLENGAMPPSSVGFHNIENPKGGMMLYTSGTTNRPKGVFLPHSALAAQTKSLVEAWSYSPDDRLLHMLPLHHIHGTVNAILAPVLAGSSIEFTYPFNPTAVWKRLAKQFLPQSTANPPTKPINFLTAVPTIYHRLLNTFDLLSDTTKQAAKEAISPGNLRLNISGSAALPTPTKRAWTDLSGGNVLLERYGMTEVGMALSCGLEFNDRIDGSVGWPLPSVEVRLFDLDKREVIHPGEELDENGRERVGEIQLRGPTIFKEYWQNKQATEESFIDDLDGKGKWFKTGDMAIRKPVDGAGQGRSTWASGPLYFIQGRQSVDIIKVGGEKVSALEVEREILSLPQVLEAAVVGLPSEQWGQKVAAILVLDSKHAATGSGEGKPWGILDLRRALKEKLCSYKIPQEMRVLKGGIPRNAMGKVNKKTLKKEVFGDVV
ncbi:AMP-binding enzyme [Trichophyton equinum CBS 127.97]|uniref:AMP-binding enzyme n=1 Tax=Trichophyton equinum (strain ATCC MYA-4606 / CBS 127.97) TaxID=559882 RepID=F2Q3V5_TRIEC|nr:AMP-binding enzyme [Trichophyton equinum CBS 127.97]